jgi:hypothetical protein
MSESEIQSRPESAGVGRREFLIAVGAAGLASTLPAAAVAFAQAAAPAKPVPLPADSTQMAPAAPKGPSEEARALAAILRGRYKDRLTEEQWASVANDIDGDLQGLKRLAAAKLANSDEPDAVFHA